MNYETEKAASIIEVSKRHGLTSSEAVTALTQNGFSEQEAEELVGKSSFYGSVPPKPKPVTNSNFETVDSTMTDGLKHEFQKNTMLGILGGKSIFGDFFGAKAITSYAAYKDAKVGQPKSNAPRVFQRHRAVKYYAFLLLLPLVVLSPYFVLSLPLLPTIFSRLLHQDSSLLVGSGILYLWLIVGYVSYIFITCLLFLAKKERSIATGIKLILTLDLLFFVALVIIARSPQIFVLGLFSLAPCYWISKRVGLLSQL